MNYTILSSGFSKVKNLDVKAVGDLIGGKIKQNIDAGVFKNACAIRLSYAIHEAGGIITKADGAVSSGADSKWYLFRVTDMEKYVKRISKEKVEGTKLSDFSGKKGFIVFLNCGWSDATGHIDLFDGTQVEGKEYWGQCMNAILYVIE